MRGADLAANTSSASILAREILGDGRGHLQQRQHWDLAASGQWYDFAVTCDADPTYYRRFAGRVETGKHTVSDPAMGMADL